ncbi:MAG: DUF5343 domain-containing protein [Chloroflexi bacterium]|nr:DUF5343 domain-containing protein [Chloroflexota bacterium]
MVNTSTTKKSYPFIPTRTWWELRRRFKQSLPREVDSSYLQTILGIGDSQARSLLIYLKVIGLIDDTGKLTPRANQWRDDEQYSALCEEIRHTIYPPTLLDALPPPNPDRSQAEGWFLRETGVGQKMAAKLASFYLLLAAGDIASEKLPSPKSSDGVQRVNGNRATPRPPSQRPGKVTNPATKNVTMEQDSDLRQPSLHIDIQIHIDASASSEQIDSIFSSMARHLYGKA